MQKDRKQKTHHMSQLYKDPLAWHFDPGCASVELALVFQLMTSRICWLELDHFIFVFIYIFIQNFYFNLSVLDVS